MEGWFSLTTLIALLNVVIIDSDFNIHVVISLMTFSEFILDVVILKEMTDFCISKYVDSVTSFLSFFWEYCIIFKNEPFLSD